MKKLSKINIRSFLLLLFAFVGNAQIFNLDISLFFILPPLIILTISNIKPLNVTRTLLLLIIVFCLLTIHILTFTKEVIYFPLYVLWPLKAIILIILFAYTSHYPWPLGNTLLFFIMTVILIMIGKIEEGRLVSLFGPNMLYRIFGMLLFFTLLNTQFSTNRFLVSFFYLLSLVVALYGLILTGSSGAIIVMLMIIAIYASAKIHNLYYLVSMLLVSVFACYLLVLSQTSEFVVVLRIAHKLANIEASTRLVGWLEIMSHSFSILGARHSDFWSIWSYGYMYPHNLIVELYGFYGLFGVIMIGFLLVNLRYLFQEAIRANIFAMSGLVIFLGSMFSGDLSDNYGALGLGIGLLLQKRARASSKNLLDGS